MHQRIRFLAKTAAKRLPKSSASFGEAKLRSNKPMDYLRCVEFPLAYQQLSLKDGMTILDLASPQWFSLFLAHEYPKIEFIYVNILQNELDQIREAAQCLGIHNICYQIEDGRRLSFSSGQFDKVVSLSTIEHIAPDVGGDVAVMKELNRVLAPKGSFTFSVPLKTQRRLVYDDKHPVWERQVQQKNFYMRDYDMAQVQELLHQTGFSLTGSVPMYERIGLFSMEYWENEGRVKIKTAREYLYLF